MRFMRTVRQKWPRAYRRARSAYDAVRRRWRFTVERRRLIQASREEYRSRLRDESAFRMSALYAKYYETEPLRKDFVLYESSRGATFGGDPYALLKYLLESRDYTHMRHVVAVKDVNHPIAHALLGHERVQIVQRDSEEYVRYCQSCEFLVNDTAFSPYLIKREDQVLIYTPRETPLKKIGRDTSRPWEARDFTKSLLACDFLVSPNRFTTDTVLHSYYADTLFAGTVTEFGSPRNDLVVGTDGTRVRSLLGIPSEKRIVLYAPAFSGSSSHSEGMLKVHAGYAESIQRHLGDEYAVVTKMPSAFDQYLNGGLAAGFAPGSCDTHELMSVADALISGYSGTALDFLVTGRPVVFAALDGEQISEADYYILPGDMPGPVCKTVEEVVAALEAVDQTRSEYEAAYRDCAARFVGADDGRACQRVAEVAFRAQELHPAGVYKPPATKRERILMYCGALKNNGVTESLVSLLNHIDYERYDVAVLFPNASESLERHVDVNRNAGLHYSSGTWGYTEEEYVQLQLFRRFGLVSGGLTTLQRLTARNMRRVFAGARFDHLVNYHGYSSVWALALALGVDASRRSIYLHSDVNLDRQAKHSFLHATFSTYARYDALYCVSEASMAANVANAGAYILAEFGFDIEQKIDHVMNLIEAPRILEFAERYRTESVDGVDYLRVPERGTPGVIEYIRRPEEDTVSFVSVGRLSPEKRHDRLLKAFARVVAAHSSARLYIVGEGVERPAVSAMAKSLHIEDKVVFTGYIKNPYPLIALCDCLVLSSDFEGQPLVVLEALVLGKPVISTDTPGARGLLEPDYGVLVGKNVPSLAKAMEEFASAGMERDRFDYEEHNRRALEMFYAKVCRSTAVVS